MTQARMPVYFLSHGGGPWPWVPSMRAVFDVSAREFAALPARLGVRPRAILAISGHWEAPGFTVSTAARPPMEYDYSGFPPDTYTIRYPAPGAPELAAEVKRLLEASGLAAGEDAERGFDHGVFVPLSLMYPDADIPVVMLSLQSGYDPATHLRVGAALAPLRDEGVLIVGTGLTYHNMRGFGSAGAASVSADFEAYLRSAIGQDDARVREQLLVDWQSAPSARQAHPREDHLLPLMVVAGAAQQDRGRLWFTDHAMNVTMASYEFGTPPGQAV
jgi:aromatic ring-opening dioxygenase catalytic subunit (LigB family)